MIDVYANQVEIPAHLATLEFFHEASDLLVVGGWLQVNVGAMSWDDPLAKAVGATLAEVFGQRTLALEVPFSRNVILNQRLGAPLIDPLDPEFLATAEALAALTQRSRLPGTWGYVAAGDAQHLSDRHAPLEALQRQSLYSGVRLP